jgi:hypothetical protein
VEDSGLLIPCIQVETYPSTDRNYVKTLFKVINAINLPNMDKMMKPQKKTLSTKVKILFKYIPPTLKFNLACKNMLSTKIFGQLAI